MSKLQEFMDVLTGTFDNSLQFQERQQAGDLQFPLAKHINTLCNDKVANLPEDFAGCFLLEESYYTIGENTRAMPHLFLFTEEEDGRTIRLTSYDMPQGYEKDTFTYEKLGQLEYGALRPSEKFTPALYTQKDGVWEGGSVSMFTPIMKFTLFERFSAKELEVAEVIEVNGKRTFGYDVPILYQRKEAK